MKLKLLLYVLTLFQCHWCQSSVATDSADEKSGGDSEWSTKPKMGTKEEFQLLLKQKRREQISAVKRLQSFAKYEQKYQMIDKIFGKIFEVEETGKQTIESSGYVWGGDLPEEGSALEALSQVVENCAFFGDIVLRLPDISHRLLSTRPAYAPLYKWCVSFSMATDLLDKNTQKMFDLLAQELEIVPKSDDFVNPYKTDEKPMKTNANQKSSKTKPRIVKKDLSRTEL